MDKKLSRHLAKTGFRAASMLTENYQLINEYCEDEDLKERLKISLRKLIADIGADYCEQLYKLHPEIKIDIEESIDKYGFMLW